MRQNSPLFRLSASVAIGALLGHAALAQPAPPPPAAPIAPPGPVQVDPPDRVGRIASETGAVSFRTSADTEWSAAASNYPVSSGNAFWTEPSARAELEISASRIDLSGQTELDVTTLDAGGLQAVLPQGELYLHLTDPGPNEAWSVQTPRGTVRLTEAGRYGIVAGTTGQPTQITVLEGAATLTGPGVALTIAANHTATVEGDGPFQATIGPEARDAFLAARLAAERPPAPLPPPVAARLRYLPEIGDLAGSGEWGDEPDYGEVWYPPVAPGWIPYQNGQWAYVAPWGWTWVDSSSWGFVPFHYGRWAHIGHRWGWVPGEARTSERPVYAPALVAFLGVAAGAAIANGSVGWVPLGPGEAYHPWYRASSGYVRQINAGHVRDPAAISRPVGMSEFANRAAATSVPAGVMLGSRLVRPAARPMSAVTFAASRPVIGEQPITPTAVTLGVTPAVAHQLRLAGGDASHRAAPGPVVRVQEPGATNRLPGLVEQPGGASRPGEPRTPGPNAEPAPSGPLPLVVPGARSGLYEPRGAGLPPPPSDRLRPEGRPGPGPEIVHPPEAQPQRPPGGRPLGAPPELHEGRTPQPPGGPPVIGPQAPPHLQAVPIPGQEPAGHMPAVERPFHEPPPALRPEFRQAPPRIESAPAPHALPPPPRVEAPRIAPPPQVEAPRIAPPPRIEAPRLTPPPPPRVEAPRMAPPPPPRVEAPRIAPPPSPRVEAPRIAPPPPHVEAPRQMPPRQEPAPQRRPGEP
jgi:hypothetical protein